MIRRPGDDEGAALITVMLVMMLLTSLVTAAVGYGMAAQPLSRRDQDTVAALAAAQAGIDDYLFRVRQSEFEQRSSTNLPPAPDNTPFLSTTWQSVPGATNGAKFHYDAKLATGALTVTSSGRVRNVTRTVQVLVRRASFLDYLYFTDFEVMSPASGFYGANQAAAQTGCPFYWWSGNRSSSTCTRISFGGGDAINGDLHTNDTISVSGTVSFNGQVTTSLQTAICTPAKRWWNTDAGNGCGTPAAGSPSFSRTGDPAYQPILTLPQTSGDLRNDADATGCIFVGPTRLVLNSAGTMDTTSPFTTTTTTDADNYNRCVGSNKTLPGVIFTRNALTSSPDETSGQCTGWTGNRIGFPIQNVGGDSSADDITRYGCASGDIFVSGVLNGRLTVAAEDNVVVVDDVTYQSFGQTTEDDLLGLIAEQFVWVYHPISCPSSYVVDVNSVRTCQDQRGTNLVDTRFNTDTGGLFQNPRIHAAVLALNHSLGVQQFNNGAQLGTLLVYGAIAQKWRGAVALSGATGYVKDYRYDPRLEYEGPPSFVDPVGKPWKVKAFAEVANPPPCTATRVSLCVPP